MSISEVLRRQTVRGRKAIQIRHIGTADYLAETVILFDYQEHMRKTGDPVQGRRRRVGGRSCRRDGAGVTASAATSLKDNRTDYQNQNGISQFNQCVYPPAWFQIRESFKIKVDVSDNS